MSDLLQRMIERTRGPLSPVQPIMPSIFSGADATGFVEFAPVEATPIAPPISTIELAPVVSMDIRPNPRKEPQNRATVESILPESEKPGLPLTNSGRKQTQRLESAANSDPQPMTSQTADDCCDGLAVPITSPTEARHAEPTAITREAPIPLRTQNGPATLQPTLTAERPLARRDTRHQSPAQQKANAAVAPERAKVPVPQQKHEGARLAPPRMESPGQPVEVSVSIGHIEVRSIQRDPPRERRTAARPRVSLEAFLKRSAPSNSR
jgi:hypothetical protein